MFRIRKKIFPDKGHKSVEKKYQDFLEENRILFPKNFFNMFHDDFFHDGIVKIRKFDFRKNELHLDIDCPNFMDENGKFVDIEFCCHFLNVFSLAFEPEVITGKMADFAFQDSIFLHGEIGTMIDPHIAQSLIIKCLSVDNRIFYISLIFRKCELTPKYSLQYKKLKSSGKIRLE